MEKYELMSIIKKELEKNKEHVIKAEKEKITAKQKRIEFAVALGKEQYYRGQLDALADVLNLIQREL